MIRRARLVPAGLLACALLLAACATEVRPLAPTLFPAQVAAGRLDATVVRLELADPGQRYRSPHLQDWLRAVEVPIGAIVEAAGGLALAAEFAPSAPAAASDPQALRLRVDGVVADVDSRWAYFVPLGPVAMSRVDVTTRLGFGVHLVGAGGAVHWTQRYDSGVELLQLQRHGLVLEPVPDGVQRRLHEQAARLMRQAAGDLRAWLAQERRRERVL